ncbi:MAG: family 10 glycosylhydrolase [Oscillospiraceae bacterium]
MKKQNKNITAVMAVIAIFLVLSVVAGVFMATRPTGADGAASGDSLSTDTSSQKSDSIESTASNSSSISSAEKPQKTPSKTPTPKPPKAEQTPSAQPTSGEYRGVWISYLEYQGMDMSSRDGFVRDITATFKNCADMGINTVIVHVRPFGDALYKSSIFPQSHLLSGTQGQDAGYDPLAEMVNIAHSMGLKIEAWVNPYRVQLSSKMPSSIAATNPAKDSSLTFSANGGVYYNPALPQVQDLVVRGIEEIVANYQVDGIHIDDYFYPTTDLAIDKKDYDASGSALSQSDWRRENVNSLVRKIYDKIKSVNSAVTFGISPQGNNDNNYNTQYSDVKLWLSQTGYADYVMPQLYWGFNYLTKSGREDYQFAKLAAQWAKYPRADGVKLYIGLGAYRIGAGDGGSNDQGEWSSGTNLAKMVNATRGIDGISGTGMYRYDNLFKNSENSALAQSEREHLAAAFAG